MYGDTGTALATFGQVVAAGTAPNALPALANIDPPRMVQVQVRLLGERGLTAWQCGTVRARRDGEQGDAEAKGGAGGAVTLVASHRED